MVLFYTVSPSGDKWQSKTLFLAFFIRFRRLFSAFLLPLIRCEHALKWFTLIHIMTACWGQKLYFWKWSSYIQSPAKEFTWHLRGWGGGKFWLSYCIYALLVLKPQPIRDMTVKCVGSVRHIDVKEYSKLNSLGPYQWDGSFNHPKYKFKLMVS